MSLEQNWKVDAFAGQIRTAKAEVDLVYAGKGHWSASSTGPAGDISLAAPGAANWPRLERLMRVLVAVGIARAKVIFRGLPPAFASDPAMTQACARSAGGSEQYAKVIDFSERAKIPGIEVELEFGRDGLWYVYASGPDGRQPLTPIFGEGWGRLEGVLQILAGAGLTEARVRWEGMPPALVAAGNP